MPDFFSAKYMFAMVPTKEYSVQNSAASKAAKAVSCITDFGVSTAIITLFVGGASWTLDSITEAAHCNTKVTKKFISVALQKLHID